MRDSVLLPGNPHAAPVGAIWRDELGLWHGYSEVFKADCGPFGTRVDAEAEVVDMWERSWYLTYYRSR